MKFIIEKLSNPGPSEPSTMVTIARKVFDDGCGILNNSQHKVCLLYKNDPR